MNNLFPFLSEQTLNLIIKLTFLVLIGLYGIFVFVVFHHIRSLNKIVVIQKTTGSPLMKTLALAYLIAAISLFLVAVVIL